MEIKVDKNLCIGCGACIALCPEVFRYDSDGKSEINEGADINKNGECVKKAEIVCPVKAISIKE